MDENLIIEGNKLIGIKNKLIKEIAIPEGIEYIVDNVFIDYENLEKVTLPSSLKRIASETFENCGNLKEIVISEGTEELGNYVFCLHLKIV